MLKILELIHRDITLYTLAPTHMPTGYTTYITTPYTVISDIIF